MKFLIWAMEIAKKKENQKYIIVGVSSAVSVLFFTWILTDFFSVDPLLSVPVSVEITIVWGFFALDKWAFKIIRKKHSIFNRFVRYNLVALSGLILNVTIFTIFTNIFEIFYLHSEIIAILFTASFNFIITKKFAWSQNL